jgi:hypothetical protein
MMIAEERKYGFKIHPGRNHHSLQLARAPYQAASYFTETNLLCKTFRVRDANWIKT